MFLRVVQFLVLLLALCCSYSASDSVIVEAAKANRNLSPPNANILVQKPLKLVPSEVFLVRPYNILEVSCPNGYVLVNKHCHRRVRGATAVN